MTTTFITLHTLREIPRQMPSVQHVATGEDLPFLQWRNGHKVMSNNVGNSVIWTIKSIQGDSGPDARMSYTTEVKLTDSEGEDKYVRGSTLQSGYHIVAQGEDDELNEATREVDNHEPVQGDAVSGQLPAVVTNPVPDGYQLVPLVLNVDTIRNFYPRKPERNGRERSGTRVLLKSGQAYPVHELFEQVLALVQRAGGGTTVIE